MTATINLELITSLSDEQCFWRCRTLNSMRWCLVLRVILVLVSIWVKHRLQAEFVFSPWGYVSQCCWLCFLVPSLAGHTDQAYPAWLNIQPTGWMLSSVCSTTGHIHTSNYSRTHALLTGMLISCAHMCKFAFLFFFFFSQSIHHVITFTKYSSKHGDFNFNFMNLKHKQPCRFVSILEQNMSFFTTGNNSTEVGGHM